MGYSEEQGTPASIWAVDGEGSISVTSVAGNAAGYFSNKITMPTQAGSEASVIVRSGESEAHAEFGPIRVIAGAPANIALISSGTSHVMEQGLTTITATVHDQFGNPVADGTPIDWLLDGSAVLKSSDDIVVNGVATAVVAGGMSAGLVPVSAKVENVTQILNLDIKPLDIQVIASAAVNTGDLFQVSAVVKDSEGQPVDGLFVAASSDVGRTSVGNVYTNSSGEVSFRVRASNVPVEGTVGVLV